MTNENLTSVIGGFQIFMNRCMDQGLTPEQCIGLFKKDQEQGGELFRSLVNKVKNELK